MVTSKRKVRHFPKSNFYIIGKNRNNQSIILTGMFYFDYWLYLKAIEILKNLNVMSKFKKIT